MTRLRRLADPRPAPVRADPGGIPAALDGVRVETVAEDWVVEDRWWTGDPLRRRYFELILADGHDAVVFHDLLGDGWYLQRA
jgi:hypothetical protein